MKEGKQDKAPIVTAGTVIGDKARTKANHFSGKKRQSLMNRGMTIIYGEPGIKAKGVELKARAI
jgi:hypothetical protein